MYKRYIKEKIFYDTDARSLLEKYYPSNNIERKLIKTVHKAGHDENQIDCILYSLEGSPAKGVLLLSLTDNEIKSIRIFNSWGKRIATYLRYSGYKIGEREDERIYN